MRPRPEPFRIRAWEPISAPSRDERRAILEHTGYNVFSIKAEDVLIDLLTDSGTGSMSQNQWAALMRGDESYAGSRSYDAFATAVESVLGMPHVLPAHQGRGAEHVFFRATLEPGAIVPSNAFFDTTRAHAELAGARALDLACAEAADTRSPYPFKGNIDLDRLEALLDGPDGARVPFVLVTITNNTGGGQPVSLENLTETAVLARSRGRSLVLDIARYAENAWFVRDREPGQEDRSVAEIVRSQLALADVALMSAKTDASVNIGGFVACRDPQLHERLKTQLILFEGFPTYGGLAGRDLEAIAVGLYESVDEELLAHRVGQVAELARCLEEEAGVPVMRPAGGHAVYVDCAGLFPHVPPALFPGQAFACELYAAGGVRCVEVGSNMAGRDPETGRNRHPLLELARLAIPRRTYTASQLDLVVEAAAEVAARRDEIHGVELTWEPADSPALRHFTARFAPVRVRATAPR